MPGTDTRKIPTKPRRLRLSEPGAHCLRQHEKQTPQAQVSEPRTISDRALPDAVWTSGRYVFANAVL